MYDVDDDAARMCALINLVQQHLETPAEDGGGGAMLVFFASISSCENAAAVLANQFGSASIDAVHSGQIADAERQRVVQRLLDSGPQTEPFVICATSVSVANQFR